MASISLRRTSPASAVTSMKEKPDVLKFVSCSQVLKTAELQLARVVAPIIPAVLDPKTRTPRRAGAPTHIVGNSFELVSLCPNLKII